MSKITDYPPGPGINGSEQVLIATPAGPASTNYTYTTTAIRTWSQASLGNLAFLNYPGGTSVFLRGDGTFATPAGAGTVTSVGLSMPGIFSVAGSPVTGAGTLAVTATDPGADRVAFWDDSASDMAWLTMGSNLSITGTTLNATGGGGVAWGAITGTLTDQTDLNSALALKAPLASPTLTGTPAAPTAAVDTNTTQIATTAYVVAQAASATPANNGTAAAGTSLRYARGDHVHNSDSTKANLASPTFTGVPAAPTAAPGTNTTQIATTAYADAIAALKANLASPTFTGTPAAPTAAVDTNTTQLATTAFVVAQAASATPANNGTAAVGTSLRYARGDHVHNSDSTKANLASPTFTGDPLAPTPTTGDDDTSIATTAFVQASVTAIAQNSQSAAYTLVLSDKGKHIFHPSADTTARVWTIPANASVAFAVGTVITFVNQNAGGVITIAITTDTMRLAGAGTTGSRTLAANGIATAIKVTSTEWLINGTGLT